jgi:hypothetical protein
VESELHNPAPHSGKSISSDVIRPFTLLKSIVLTFHFGKQIQRMAPISHPSSAILTALLDVKEFLWQHYIVVIVGIVAARLIYFRYLTPYRDVPGPFLATISPLWRLRGALNGTLHKDITAAHRKYGPIFRIAPDEVSISDPEAIKTIYAHGAGFTKVPQSFSRLMTDRLL